MRWCHLAVSLVLFCVACGPRTSDTCPVVDQEALAARIADIVYERLQREGYVRERVDPADVGASADCEQMLRCCEAYLATLSRRGIGGTAEPCRLPEANEAGSCTSRVEGYRAALGRLGETIPEACR